MSTAEERFSDNDRNVCGDFVPQHGLGPEMYNQELCGLYWKIINKTFLEMAQRMSSSPRLYPCSLLGYAGTSGSHKEHDLFPKHLHCFVSNFQISTT
jgi:hypothetical protein